jgi:hypothetical protein
MRDHVLIVGPLDSGAALRSITSPPRPDWQVTTVSRRVSPVEGANTSKSTARRAGHDGSLHTAQRVDPTSSAPPTSTDPMSDVIARNLTMLSRTLTALEAAGADLHRVFLRGGGKSHGEHLGPYKTPATERDPTTSARSTTP